MGLRIMDQELMPVAVITVGLMQGNLEFISIDTVGGLCKYNSILNYMHLAVDHLTRCSKTYSDFNYEITM